MEHKQKPKSTEEILPKDLESTENKNISFEIMDLEKQINVNNLLYESSKCNYDFKNIATTRSLSDDIYSGKITISEGNKKQVKPRPDESKKKQHLRKLKFSFERLRINC